MTQGGSLAIGTVLGGDYVIERLITSGGMGSVYVARQRSTHKLRALKTMLPHLAQEATFRVRFMREATVASQIESDHVVETLAAGVDEATGVPWLAMELLSGDDLARHVATKGPLSRADAIELFKQLGHALSTAHRASVVHRDLKPENIFLATPRREGVPFTVKVLDFGIAKLLTESQSTTTTALGSPLWMSPEQTSASSEISPATDVWSLGLIAFWALTRKRFWLAGNTPGAPLAAMIVELTADPIPSASERARALGVSDALPPGFDAWFARCAARSPSARFPNAGEAIPALIGVLSAAAPLPSATAPTALPTMAIAQTQLATIVGAPVAPALPPPPPPPTRPGFTADPRSKYIAGGVAGVLALIFGAVVGKQTLRPPRARAAFGVAPPPAAAPVANSAQTPPPPPPGDASVAAGPGVSPSEHGVSGHHEHAREGADSSVTYLPPIGFPTAGSTGPAGVIDAGQPTPPPPPPIDAGRPQPPIDAGQPQPPSSPTPPPPPLPPPPPPPPSPPSPPPPDPCAERHACLDCTVAIGCGWCSNTHRCISADRRDDPSNAGCNYSEDTSSCRRNGDPCGHITTCADCLSASFCAWCSSNNRCEEASSAAHHACRASVTFASQCP